MHMQNMHVQKINFLWDLELEIDGGTSQILTKIDKLLFEVDCSHLYPTRHLGVIPTALPLVTGPSNTAHSSSRWFVL